MFENIDKKNNPSKKVGKTPSRSRQDINLLPGSIHAEKSEKKKKSQAGNPKITDYHVPVSGIKSDHQGDWIKKEPARVNSKKSSFWTSLFRLRPKKVKPIKPKKPGIVELSHKTEKEVKNVLPKVEVPKLKIGDKSSPNLISRFEKTLETSEEENNDKNKGVRGKKFNEVRRINKTSDEIMEVNLLPIAKKRLTRSQAISGYVIIISVCATAIITPYLYYKGKNDNYKFNVAEIQDRSRAVKRQIADEKERISSYGPLAKKLQFLQELFSTHVYWSEFFPTLEKHTSRNVHFESVSVNNGEVTLHGQARDLRSAGEQLIIFRNNTDYLDVALTDLSFIRGEEDQDIFIDVSFSFMVSPNIILNNDINTE